MAESPGHPLYRCRKCRNPVALGEDLLSKSYLAKSGQAYMFGQAMNIVVGENEERELITGHFTIADIYCANCRQELGWKYIRAYDEREKFKEGTFIIEKAKIVKEY